MGARCGHRSAAGARRTATVSPQTGSLGLMNLQAPITSAHKPGQDASDRDDFFSQQFPEGQRWGDTCSVGV